MKPKYIRIASDLHLEQNFGQREEFLALTFLPADPRDEESVLVLAGDISSKPTQLLGFIREVEKRFLKVYYVPGNHEFYGHDMNKWAEDFQASMSVGPFDSPENKKTEFAILDMCYEELEGIRFIFGTLWADGGGSLYDQAQVGRGLRDFYVIRKEKEKRFTVPDMVEIHRRQKKQLLSYLEQPFDGKTVVITHHVPSYRLCHPRFGVEINGGFASNCDNILATEVVDLWIFGHTHDTIDRNMWKTRVVCNPSGYNSEKNSGFNYYGPKFVEIERIYENEPPPQEPV